MLKLDAQVETKLNSLHLDAKRDSELMEKIRLGLGNGPVQPEDFENLYLPISKEQGLKLRQLIIENSFKNVIEFGTSFGISTIYLADGVQVTGGKVISTELLENKANKALQNIEEAGLISKVEIRIGDAMVTLKDYADSIDFLFLDGWKDLYLPLFKMLKNKFHKKTLIYADNIDMESTKEYLNYILHHNEIFNSQIIHDGKGLLTSLK